MAENLPAAAPADQAHEELAVTAKTWMQRGIALLSAGKPEVLKDALHCFDQALELRRQLPWQTNEKYRWLLTACWMNRGDVLTRLGGPPMLLDAVRSFDEAITVLEALPLDADPQYRGRLVLAWMNRSLALRFQEGPESLDEALFSLARAESTLLEGTRAPDMSLLASIIMNRAALLLEFSPPRAQEALQGADTLIELCGPTEKTDELAFELGLKARHVFCRAVAYLLETPPVDPAHADDWLMRATDRVDEALRLTAIWSKQDTAPAFQILQFELFRFGCHMYLAWQPHFLADFILDVLDAERHSPLFSDSKQLHAAGMAALAMAAEVLKRRGPLDFGLNKVDRLIEVIGTLNEAADRIKNQPCQL
ncbi:MAG: hypothetical protein V4662_09720 [Verrucomicrobiota bacterium]